MGKLLIACVLALCTVLVNSAWVEEMENHGNPSMYQGDIVLDPDEDERGMNGTRTYAAIKGSRWPGGKIAYEIKAGIGSKGRKAIMAAISNYHKHTCIRFHRRRRESSYISFYKGNGCFSGIGHRRGRVNKISLAPGCWYTGIVMHEIGHSMGFFHEQSRPDRDRHVRIIWRNIQKSMQYNFKKSPSKRIDSLNTPYDYQSMMHYGSKAFGGGRMTIQTIDPSKQRLIGQRKGFSRIDIIQLNRMYKCKGSKSSSKKSGPKPGSGGSSSKARLIRGTRGCWSKCGNRGGRCSSVCGRNGYCCQKGYPGCSASVARANPYKQHACVRVAAAQQQATLITGTQGCWGKCGGRGGSCPSVCGVNGYCCRKGYPGCTTNVAKANPYAQHACVRVPRKGKR